jgi:multiple sugar transport system permease protein
VRAPERWSRWTAGVGIVLAVVAMMGLVGTFLRARRVELRAADAGTATAVAGYLSLVTPAEPSSSDYQLPPLLSAAHTLASTPGWSGIQVAWRNAPLLPDPIGLTPLAPEVEIFLSEGHASTHVERRIGDVTLVPLLDRDLWKAVGWVGAWGTVRGDPVTSLTLSLALVTVVAIAMAVHLARPGESSRRRWTSAGVAVLAMLILSFDLGNQVQGLARQSTDAVLLRARHLAERAATIPRVPEGQLARIIPGHRIRMTEGAGSADSTIQRVHQGDEPLALIRVPLRSGAILEISSLPREALLANTWAALLAWVALLGLGLGFSAWAGAAQADRRGFRETLTAWGFIGPAMVHLAVFAFAPLLFAAYLSLHRWGLVESVRPFVGLANFREIFGDARFWHSLGVTALYSLYVPVTMVLSLGAALALDRGGVRIRLARAVLFLPFISSVVAVALVWQWMYQADFGLINIGLARLGIRGPDWLGDPGFALISVMILSAWVHLGYQMIIFLAGLQGIPRVYHDAARVDGAGSWQRFRRITLPLLRPTILFVLVTGTISSFQVFTYVSVMTEGGPLFATDVVVYRIYQEAWEFLRFGTASAMSLVLLLILLAATWVQFRWLGKKVELI